MEVKKAQKQGREYTTQKKTNLIQGEYQPRMTWAGWTFPQN